VVEDNETDVFVIREVLKDCGTPLDIRVARDGEQALAQLREFQPVLVLLDLNIPKRSGLEVLAAIRDHPRWAKVPVVVVTSSDSKRDHQAAQSLNATSYFQKPNSLREFMALAEIVRSILAAPAPAHPEESL